MLAGEVDMCVHSSKDLPSELPEGCKLGGMLARGSVHDVVVLGNGNTAACMDDIKPGARIGTGSMRHAAQIRAKWPSLVPVDIRGNVETRLAKADSDEYDGVVLAAAGIERMGFTDRITFALSPDVMVPAVGQGAIGIEIRENDSDIAEMVQAIADAATTCCVGVERAVLAAWEGGCQAPLGVYARFAGNALLLDAVVLSPDGTQCARVHVEQEEGTHALELAQRAVVALEEQGARSILAHMSTSEVE